MLTSLQTSPSSPEGPYGSESIARAALQSSDHLSFFGTVRGLALGSTGPAISASEVGAYALSTLGTGLLQSEALPFGPGAGLSGRA